MELNQPHFGISAFVLKIIAAVTMLIDHVGAYLFPEILILRIIGRLSFPIFAFLIAEGCRYTRNKRKRFLLVFGLAVVCEAGFFVLSDTLTAIREAGCFVPSEHLTGTVLLTFSCSILIIYALQWFKKTLVEKVWWKILLAALALAASVVGAYFFAKYVPADYGFAGILLPVFVSLFDYKPDEAPTFLRRLDCRPVRLCMTLLGVLAVWFFRGRNAVQFFGVLALLPLALYNGQPGIKKFKYWFYVFYPAHLGVIWVIGRLMEM